MKSTGTPEPPLGWKRCRRPVKASSFPPEDLAKIKYLLKLFDGKIVGIWERKKQ